ncbi:hypothetical protein [Luteolibacter sp. Populi]|uniref:hypothetical protein n=1 Tax=Luteolibacter sp. Populi TaxID=3230487 RepID=UPI0034669181
MKPVFHRSARRYARLLIGLATLCLVLVGLANSTVNPWRVTPVPWEIKSLDNFRGTKDHLRTTKAGILRSGEWKVALVGSSRVANAFDPSLPSWGRSDVVNLGCNAAFLNETTAIGRYFLEHEPAELLLLGIDPGDLTSKVDTRPLFDFDTSPFSPDSGLDNELRYVFGLSTFEASITTVQDGLMMAPAEYGPKGMRRSPRAHPGTQHKFIASTFTTPNELETADAAGPDRPLNEGKLGKLRDLLEECQARDCRVVVFFHSNHALMHAETKHIGSGVIPFEKERRVLVKLIADLSPRSGRPIELWDFCNYHALNCEAVPSAIPEGAKAQETKMANWNDLGHFTPEVGSQMLALMLGWPLPHPEWSGIGRKLDPANLDAYLHEVGTGYQRYLTQEGAKDLAWKEGLKVVRSGP